LNPSHAIIHGKKVDHPSNVFSEFLIIWGAKRPIDHSAAGEWGADQAGGARPSRIAHLGRFGAHLSTAAVGAFATEAFARKNEKIACEDSLNAPP